MVVSRGICPECHSHEVTKERIMGAQTGDLICLNPKCKFSGSPSRFSQESEPKIQELSSDK